MIKVNPTMFAIPKNDEQFKEQVLSLLIEHGAQINTIHGEMRKIIATEIEKALADKFILINDVIREGQEILGQVKKK